MALGAGTAYAVGRESVDNTIKSVTELTTRTGLPLLATFDLMETDKERRARRVKIALVILVLLAVVAAALICIHLFYMPLDIFWIKLQRRLTRMF